MKRIIGFFIAFALSVVVYPAMAQYEQDENALRNYAERNTYGDNWFFSLGGNANLLVAEQDGDVDFTKRIKFGGSFTLGKWFNQDFGVRLQVMGGSLRGFNFVDYRGFQGGGAYYKWNNYSHHRVPMGVGWEHRDDKDVDPYNDDYRNNFQFVASKSNLWGFWQDFNYGTATLDLMANVTNLFRGRYRDRNPVDFIGLVGLGAIHAFKNKATTPDYTHFVAKIGFRMNLNVSNNFAIYVEPQANMTTNEFDGYSGDSFGDGILNISAGFQLTFNKGFKSLSDFALLTADEIDRLNKKINDQRYLIENHQDILERQQSLLDRLGNCCDENARLGEVNAQMVEASRGVNAFGGVGGGSLPEYVRFSIDSYKIEPIEQRKLNDVADYLKDNPNSKLLIIGYADRKTGNPPYNYNLSQKRVEGVANELKRLGVNANRLIVEWKGDVEQPFPQNEWNRVVILVEKK